MTRGLAGRQRAQQSGAVALRLRQRTLWDRAAGRRAEGRAFSGNTVTRRLLEIAQVQPNSFVLDMACGSGDPGVATAQVAQNGHVLGLDVSKEMIAHGRLAATHAGVRNATFRMIEDETVLGVGAQKFDIVLCRFGLMFMPNPGEALRHWVRALVPGGRVAICTHAALPAFELTMREVESLAPTLAARLEWRRVLSLSHAQRVTEIFRSAGLTDVSVRCHRTSDHHSLDVEERWESMLSRSPLRDALDELDVAASRTIRDACIRRLAAAQLPLNELFSNDVLYAVGVARCGTPDRA